MQADKGSPVRRIDGLTGNSLKILSHSLPSRCVFAPAKGMQSCTCCGGGGLQIRSDDGDWVADKYNEWVTD